MLPSVSGPLTRISESARAKSPPSIWSRVDSFGWKLPKSAVLNACQLQPVQQWHTQGPDVERSNAPTCKLLCTHLLREMHCHSVSTAAFCTITGTSGQCRCAPTNCVPHIEEPHLPTPPKLSVPLS
eukprot:5292219-Amphidinium_carterae.1